MIKPLEPGEGRPRVIATKINEIIGELNILSEDYAPTEITRQERLEEVRAMTLQVIQERDEENKNATTDQ